MNLLFLLVVERCRSSIGQIVVANTHRGKASQSSEGRRWRISAARLEGAAPQHPLGADRR
ncbi:MAG: hypothetical protein AAGM29_23005 [Cyanobacteria bacterium J06588_4]